MTSRPESIRSRRTLPRVGLALAALLAFTVAACDSSPTNSAEGDASIQILMTDYPLEDIESAEVTITRVYLVGGGQAPFDLFQAEDEEDAWTYDLLELQDGVTAELTDLVDVPAGTYGQLRFEIASAVVTLEEGSTFGNGEQSMEAMVPSGSVAVNLKGATVGEDGSLTLPEGEATVVTIDFDVEESFVFQGPPEAATGVTVLPVLREISRTIDGEEQESDD